MHTPEDQAKNIPPGETASSLHAETLLRWEGYIREGLRALTAGTGTDDTLPTVLHRLKELAATGALAKGAYAQSLERLRVEARAVPKAHSAITEALGELRLEVV